MESLPSWERGLKYFLPSAPPAFTIVAPLVGAWIEIPLIMASPPGSLSLPSWERGLKFTRTLAFLARVTVAPLVGAWIEIFQ